MFAWDYEQEFNCDIGIKQDGSCVASKCVLSHWHSVYVTSKTRKGKIEQGIHGWYKSSNIYEGLLNLWWDSKWQVKV